MIRCPDPGALRAALDAERPDVSAHVTTCSQCQARSAGHADDAAFAAARLAAPPLAGDLEVRAALAQIQSRTVAPAVATPQRRRFGGGLARAAAGLVGLALLGALLATPGGRATAASWLEQFRAERVAAVPLDLAAVDPTALEALLDLAEVEGLDRLAEPQPMADLDAAAAVAGFAATPLDVEALPSIAAGPVEVFAQSPQTVRITFPHEPGVPADIRGATLLLDVPGAVVQTVGSHGDGPAVVRGEAGALEVVVEGGPSLSEVRDALLSVPGLPAETTAALRAIEDWETTLPLPVPVGRIAWSETTVAGRPALAFGDESGLGSALLWHDGERFIGVGGPLPLSQVRVLAESGA
jgi:hypothetical protein